MKCNWNFQVWYKILDKVGVDYNCPYCDRPHGTIFKASCGHLFCTKCISQLPCTIAILKCKKHSLVKCPLLRNNGQANNIFFFILWVSNNCGHFFSKKLLYRTVPHLLQKIARVNVRYSKKAKFPIQGEPKS